MTPREAARRLKKAGFDVTEPTTKKLPDPLRIPGLRKAVSEADGS